MEPTVFEIDGMRFTLRGFTGKDGWQALVRYPDTLPDKMENWDGVVSFATQYISAWEGPEGSPHDSAAWEQVPSEIVLKLYLALNRWYQALAKN
jgi:hypothetical protein